MKRLLVLSGAGISAESGISTFRDHNGLWENHDIMEVASPEGFAKNPELVLRFYNQRRVQLDSVQPNAGHLALKELEKGFHVDIVTQNVDDLHERAGSSNIIHLHGELRKMRSSSHPQYVYPCEGDISLGQLCPKSGSQLRPHIVWFGEAVPFIEEAQELVQQADILIIVGTSMQVYPAAGLVHSAPTHAQIYYIDPQPASLQLGARLRILADKASTALPHLAQNLLKEQV